jgi:hypothetical protein
LRKIDSTWALPLNLSAREDVSIASTELTSESLPVELTFRATKIARPGQSTPAMTDATRVSRRQGFPGPLFFPNTDPGSIPVVSPDRGLAVRAKSSASALTIRSVFTSNPNAAQERERPSVSVNR